MKKLFIIISLLFLYSCGNDNIQENIDTPDNSSNQDEQVENDLENLIDSWSFSQAINELENSWDYEELSDENKDLLIHSYLQEWVYAYKESEYSQKVISILENQEQNYQNLYYLGFANEIDKNFDEALDLYNQALELEDINDSQEAVLLNQIWHVYDLMWETENAYNFYYQAYNADSSNVNVSINIARYLNKTGDYENAKVYFDYWLNTNDSALKSEIYYSLSGLEYKLNPENPDIDASIEYAQSSIETNPNYPMGYVALAKAYYMLNNDEYSTEIENNASKSIELNPNNSYAYELLWLYSFDNWEYENAYNLLLEAKSVIESDPILMNDERITYIDYINKLMAFVTLYQKLDFESDTIEDDLNMLIQNWYGIFLEEQLARSNYWIFGETNWEVVSNILNNNQ